MNDSNLGSDPNHEPMDDQPATPDADASDAQPADATATPLAYESQPLPENLAASAAQPNAPQYVQEESSAGADAHSGPTGEPTPDPIPDAVAFERVGRSAAARRIEIGMIEGDLTIIGGAREVTISSDGWDDDDQPAVEHAGVFRIARLDDDVTLSIPDDSEVYVRDVQGDLSAESLDGLIQIISIQGDVAARDIAVMILVRVEGDLTASNVGDLSVRDVEGDVKLDSLTTAPTFQRIGGGVEARDIIGIEIAGSVGGDLKIDRCEYIAIQGTVGGDVEIARCVGPLVLSVVGGDLHADTVAAVRVAKVGGDAQLQTIAGEAQCDVIGGDASLRDMRGPVRLSVVGGDLTVRGAAGGMVIARVGGDAQIETALGAQAAYDVTSGGDITLRLRGAVNARFVAQSGGEIRTRLPLTVERGRRRHLVGALGDGSATVTLHAGGDILITGGDSSSSARERGEGNDEFAGFGSSFGSTFADSFATNFSGFGASMASGFADMFTNTFAPGARRRREETMSDENTNPTNNGPQGPQSDDPNGARTWEGNIGQHKFRMRVEREPGRAGFQFKGPYTEETPPTDQGAREFNLEWERGGGVRTSGEYEQVLNEVRDRAEKVARRAAEEAKKYADMAAKRARETDWEAMGREVRSTVEKAMADLEDAFGRVRRDWEQPRSGGSGATGGATGSSGGSGGAQRVRIEQDEAGDVFGAGATGAAGSAFGGAAASPADRESQRRDILEQLRSGAITLDEAERRLNGLR